MHIFFLSQIQKNATSKRQTIVVLSKVFSCIFKRKQKSIFEHFPVICWKGLVKGVRAEFSKNIGKLEAECLWSESFSMCPLIRYGFMSWEGKVTQVLELSEAYALWDVLSLFEEVKSSLLPTYT